jgi:glycerophosphoryl diester phosphodiesterase
MPKLNNADDRATPIVIAHRGVPALRLEHTRPSYELAIEMGADYIEPDVVATKDGQLVIRHENEITGTTDVSNRPEFAARRVTKVIDGKERDGWFTEDFTLHELKTLTCKERIPEVRPQNIPHAGREPVLTLREAIEIVRAADQTVGLTVEMKHVAYFRSIGHDMNELLLAELADVTEFPLAILSFETNISQLRGRTAAKLVQNMEPGRDLPPLDEIAEYADAIGPRKDMVLGTSLVADAHALGLAVHIWTMRDEEQFRPGTASAIAEYEPYLAMGVDGYFADLTTTALAALSRS